MIFVAMNPKTGHCWSRFTARENGLSSQLHWSLLVAQWSSDPAWSSWLHPHVGWRSMIADNVPHNCWLVCFCHIAICTSYTPICLASCSWLDPVLDRVPHRKPNDLVGGVNPSQQYRTENKFFFRDHQPDFRGRITRYDQEIIALTIYSYVGRLICV